jgi:fumarylacetoacetate (FAA) hydrolase
MRLATLADGSRDGALVVVDGAATSYASAGAIAPSLQAALDEWPRCEPLLRALAERLERGEIVPLRLEGKAFGAPLPRAYEWVDGSAYLNHVVLVRKARGAEPPEGLTSDPLVYQGGSGVLLGPHDPLVLDDPKFGLDFEGEIAAVLGDVPRGTTEEDAASHVRLLLLANDVTFRDLVPPELKKGFGFFVSKPATAFAPFAVTPDELGPAFKDGRAFLRLSCTYNGARVGDLETGPEMHFSFWQLIAHVTRTRSLTAGTILGSGTVSNHDAARGVSCLAERRAREILAGGAGAPVTPYMKVGDTVRLEAFDASGRSVFGALEQAVVASESYTVK